MRVPTVRVAHPADPTAFMTINASELAPQHEIWPEQAPDFEAPVLVPERLDPALRDAAAALCLRMVALRRRAGGEPFAEMPAAEQLAVLRGLEAEVDRAEADYEEDQRDRADFEAQEVARGLLGDRPESGAEQTDPPRVSKGPRGRWYVKRGTETVSGPYETEAQAQEAATVA